MEARKEVAEPFEAAQGMASLEPKTPVANRENGAVSYDFDSPVTALKSLRKLVCFEAKRTEDAIVSADPSSPQTAKEGVFDPFALAPHGMALSPLCNKYDDQMRISIRRCLEFDSYVKAGKHKSRNGILESASDEAMIESIYESLLEAIFSEQMESFLAEISNMDWSSDDCKTPLLARRSDGTTDTCPGAPVKPVAKLRNVDSGLCRKLF